MTKEEIQYEAQSIIQEWGSNDSAPYVEFVEKLASMELPESFSDLDEAADTFNREDAARMWDYEGKTEGEIVEAAFKAGAEWMAGQGETVEGVFRAGDPGYIRVQKILAIAFMNLLDRERPEGKMCLSNMECADIEDAFKVGDWDKLFRYAEKYIKK